MLWYGIVVLFVGGTIFSYVTDGRSGIGSSETRTFVGVGYWAIPVGSLAGFVPEDYGQTYVEMEEPGELSVGGTEIMEYLAGVYVNPASASDSTWRCATPDGHALPAPCLLVRRSDPVEHPAGTYVYNENAAALNEFVGFRLAQRDTPFGALLFPFHAAGAIGSFVGKVLLWDWQFLEGNAVYFKWFLCWPLSAMLIFAIVKLFIDAASIFSL